MVMAPIASFLAARPHVAPYAVVGLLCTAFQLLLFATLLRGSVPTSAANTLAFVLSTQLNFALSHRFTWAHRRGPTSVPLRRLVVRCLGYNAAAGLGVAMNAAIFYVSDVLLTLPAMTSAAMAVAASTIVTYLLSSKVIFVAAPDRASAPLVPPLPVVGDRPHGSSVEPLGTGANPMCDLTARNT